MRLPRSRFLHGPVLVFDHSFASSKTWTSFFLRSMSRLSGLSGRAFSARVSEKALLINDLIRLWPLTPRRLKNTGRSYLRQSRYAGAPQFSRRTISAIRRFRDQTRKAGYPRSLSLGPMSVSWLMPICHSRCGIACGISRGCHARSRKPRS